ncbi:seven transmembrane domain-containing tyrosine-protein kinase 1 [Phtheirospermum japonicum]|uniref:Seven transmembrane domain-containing tyrosine-protein kinase 1 n=1 Tax=Phtheirospermum japonicum TaxID=374723 RepID=A0A830DKG3_9LAMI|nr:seven transmembrane domain-containing tyrosine-protein kinase 1 [Phtheirospermum japonicum]
MKKTTGFYRFSRNNCLNCRSVDGSTLLQVASACASTDGAKIDATEHVRRRCVDRHGCSIDLALINESGSRRRRGRCIAALAGLRLVARPDFRHEVNLIVKLRHPNIVQFLGVVTEKKPLMLVAEYLRGGDLHQHLKEKGALNPTIAINFALDIARGVAYLHSEPNVIIHRDLKPSDAGTRWINLRCVVNKNCCGKLFFV